MNRDKQIEEMAKVIDEATRFAGKVIMEETKAFVKENHRYHSKNDFDRAHEKTMSEIEAEYLTAKGYRKASEIFEEIAKIIQHHDELAERDKSEYGELIVMDIGCAIAELKKKYTKEITEGEKC